MHFFLAKGRGPVEYTSIARNVGILLLIGVLFYIGLLFLVQNEKVEEPGVSSLTKCPAFISSDTLLKYRSGWTNLTDEGFLEFIRRNWIVGPSQEDYRLMSRNRDHDPSQFGQGTFVDKALGRKRGGFFVECGAARGEVFSNTLRLERSRNWTGLLIEANPDSFDKLLKTRRKSYAVNSCLSLNNESGMVRFQIDRTGYEGFVGGIETGFNKETFRSYKKQFVPLDIQCFPFYAIIQAMGVTHIDYFSLDVEGPELEILETIPLDKVHIDMFTIEYRIPGAKGFKGKEEHGQLTLDKLQRLRTFFERTGLYTEIGILPWGTHDNKEKNERRGADVIFKRK